MGRRKPPSPASEVAAMRAAPPATTADVVAGRPSRPAPAARPATHNPRVAPPATLPSTNQDAVAAHRWPRARSASGVMVESMERPQGDQVERAAATTATVAAAMARTSVPVMGVLPSRRWSRRRPEERGGPEGEDAPVAGDEPVTGIVAEARHADDGHVEVDGAGRAVERGVAEGEDAP